MAHTSKSKNTYNTNISSPISWNNRHSSIRNKRIRRSKEFSIIQLVQKLSQKYNSSFALKICAIGLILLTGILFGQGLLNANTLSGSAQKEESVNANIVTNFYTKNKKGEAIQYPIIELP